MSSRYTIAFYNTENLFDFTQNPKILDVSFSPNGRRKWTEKRYKDKILKLSTTISKIGLEETSHPPSIVGLAEIENEKVLLDLINNEFLGDENYGFVHYDSLDERGMDVGLIYNRNVFTVEHSEPIRPPNIYGGDTDGRDRTRDVLYIKGRLKNELLYIFVVHMPSRREEDVNSPKRHAIAKNLSEIISEIQRKEENPPIIILGDFNADPTADSIKHFFKTQGEKPLNDAFSFYNPMEVLEKQGHFTNLHRKEKLLYDQILFSSSFFKESVNLKVQETHIFNPYYLQEWNKKYESHPFRTYVGNKYLGGYSDHFPVYSILNN